MVPIFVSSSSSSSRNKKKFKTIFMSFYYDQKPECWIFILPVLTVIFSKIYFSHNFCLVCLCVCVCIMCRITIFFYWFNLSIHQSIDIFCYDWLIHRTFVHSLCIDWKQWFNSCIKIFLFSNNLLSFQRFSH